MPAVRDCFFRRVSGKEMPIGVVAIPEPDYDARHWWRSSMGFVGCDW